MTFRLQKLIKKPELFFAGTALIFGLFSLFVMPLLQVPDENTHFRIAYSTFADEQPIPRDVNVPNTEIIRSLEGGNYEDYFNKKTSADVDDVGVKFKVPANHGNETRGVLDITRLPQSLGILLGRLVYPSIGVIVTSGKVLNLATYIIAVYFIIKWAKHGKWVLVFVASLPIMIQQAASLSYDPLNAVIIFAWFTYVINMYTQGYQIKRKQIVLGIFLALLLLLAKPNNVLLLLLIVGLPAKYITATHLYKKLRSSRYWKLLILASVIFGTLAVVTTVQIMGRLLLDEQAFYPRRLIVVLLNTFFWGDLTLINATWVGLIGMFSNFSYQLPAWMVCISFAILLIIMLYEKLPGITRRMAIVSGLLFFGSILFVSVGMYYNWAIKPYRLGPGADVTDGIQGRYFTPLLVLLFPAFSYLQKYIKITSKSSTTVPVLVMFSSIFLLSCYSVLTWRFFWN
jgi:uncharacterized membrane protein